MCGIVGYIGPRDATPIILNGLKRLEYRGYDSAGLAIVNGSGLEIRKDAGKLSQLIDLLGKSPINGAPGIGHTRWATHGAPNARNAHPHRGQTGRVPPRGAAVGGDGDERAAHAERAAAHAFNNLRIGRGVQGQKDGGERNTMLQFGKGHTRIILIGQNEERRG